MGSRTVIFKGFKALFTCYFSYDEIHAKLTPYLKKVGFNPKTDVTYIPCSGLTGAFLKERPSAGNGDWYT